jgi:hypothetical protein
MSLLVIWFKQKKQLSWIAGYAEALWLTATMMEGRDIDKGAALVTAKP